MGLREGRHRTSAARADPSLLFSLTGHRRRMGVYTAVAFTGVVTLPHLRWPRVTCETPASPSTARYQCLESTSSGRRLSFLRLS